VVPRHVLDQTSARQEVVALQPCQSHGDLVRQVAFVEVEALQAVLLVHLMMLVLEIALLFQG